MRRIEGESQIVMAFGGCEGCRLRGNDVSQEVHALRAKWFESSVIVSAWLCWECWRLLWQLRGIDPLGTFKGVKS